MASRMAEHQAMFERHAAALKSFYAALSPEQQRAFDALPGLMVGEHDHMGHKGPDGMGMHGMGGEPMDHPGGPQ